MTSTVPISMAARTENSAPGASVRQTAIPQYSKARVLGVWAAAALPMGALAWIVAPAIAGNGPHFIPILIGCLTAGLIWQFVLTLLLNGFSLRGLWLQRPSTSDGRRGGRLWLWVLPFVLGFGALQLLPVDLPKVADHDFGAFLGSDAGRTLLHGNWGLFALIVVMMTFNTVLGEELLFRGLLLPRMRASFGRADWIVNGVLMGAYHLHQPWSIPTSVLAGLLMAYPSRRLRSAWMGIIVHSTQSVFLTAILLGLVMS
ncbi:MAG: lysostaphin resistance A-like protein [Micromonosporaceae bacterium]